MPPPARHGIQILTTGRAGLEQFAHHGTGVHPGAGRKAPCRFALRHRMDQVLPRRDARGVAFDGALRHDHLQKILSDLNTRPQARWSSLRKRRPFAVRDHRIECPVVAWHRVHHQETKRSWSMLPHVSGSSRCRTSCVCCLLRRQSRQRSTSVGQKRIRGDACRERRTFEMGRRERAVALEIEMPQQLLHPRTRLLRQARRRRRHETRFLARRPPRSPTTTLPYPADRRALGFATEARLEPRILLLLFALLHL